MNEARFIVGLDPSMSRTGYSLVRDGVMVRSGVFPTASDTFRPERLAHIRGQVLSLLDEETLPRMHSSRAILVAMESEIFGGFRLDTDPAAVQAILQVALWEYQPRPRFLSVSTSQVKKYAGAQQKDQMLLAVYKRWGVEYRDHNEADAFVIGRIGDDFLHYTTTGHAWPEITKPQIEVLEKLRLTGLPWEQAPQARRGGKRKAKA
jgi:Holliday junction resolvasome RuvABC endonuclease subunit